MRRKISIKYSFFLLILSIVFLSAVNLEAVPVDSSFSSMKVVPINWAHFGRYFRRNKDIKQSRRILANAVRYNLGWIVKTFKIDKSRGLYIINHYGEQGIRPPASVCYGVAVGLQCADLNAVELGLSRKEAFNRIGKLIKGVAAVYKSNQPDGKGWGRGWQTALWATFVGQGAWMIWDSLDIETQKMVQTVVVNEADHFIPPDYRVPYWTSPDGHVNTPGDTKAEENAWNATLLQLAVAMMPNHPHVKEWKRVCSELMLSASSQQRDLENNEIVDGKPVKDWLHGFNVRDDGAVVNHHIIHPDYIVSLLNLTARTYLVQSLVGESVPGASLWHHRFIYQSLIKLAWSSPPYEAPGGTMYIPGKAEIYYPQGTDWTKDKFDPYYLADVNAHLLGWDKGLTHKVGDWMRIRASRILVMQSNYNDGHTFPATESSQRPGCEQTLAWHAGDAYLLFWLHAHHAISDTQESGRTWISGVW